MPADRWVLLGLAPPRADWFSEVARWTTSAALPAEFVKCLSSEQLRARLASGRAYSAVLLDGASGVDRDLVAAAESAATPVIVVGGRGATVGSAGTGELDRGVVATLAADFGRDDLVAVLGHHAAAVDRADRRPPILVDGEPEDPWQGQLVSVCGPGGTGASTVAIALAQAGAADVRHGGRVVLADLARPADQAMLHDAADLGPGLQELAESARLGLLEPDEVAALTYDVATRGYRLLLGLRRPAAWSALRPRSSDAALDALRRTYHLVVADCTADLEGEDEGGSLDVEERNHLARAALRRADAVVVVGAPGLKGLHSLAATVRAAADLGVEVRRLLPVVNRAPRSPRTRADLGSALQRLSGVPAAGPVWVPERRIEDCLRDGLPLPAAIVDPLADALDGLLGRAGRRSRADRPRPERLRPGSLGGFWGET